MKEHFFKECFTVFFVFSAFLVSCSDNVNKITYDKDIVSDNDYDMLVDEADDVSDNDSEQPESEEDITVDRDTDIFPDDENDDDDDIPDFDDDPCDPNPCEKIPLSDEVCTADGESFVCGCNSGYEWDGEACVDVDECADDFLNNCHQYADCVNTTGSYFCECKENYSGDGITCVADSREVDCTNSKPDNSNWSSANEDGKITQTWDGEKFSPPDNSCKWECLSGFHVEGDVCVSNTRSDQPCTGLPDNGVWNTADKINQSWSGSGWVPSTEGVYNTVPSTSQCRFKCRNYHKWFEEECLFCGLDNMCGSSCSECPASKPRCKDNEDGTSKCVECFSSEHCEESSAPVCDEKNNVCVECVNNSDCESGEICNELNSCMDDPCDPDPCRENTLIVSFDFDEGTGVDTADSSGNGYDAAITGAEWTSEGRYDNALEFMDDGDFVEWTYTAPANSFTMEAWFKTEEQIVIQSESLTGEGGKSGQRYLFYPGDGGPSNGGAGISVGTNGIAVYEKGDNYMPALAVYSGEVGSGWNHVVVTYSNKEPKIYLNGELVKEGLKSSRTTVFAPKIVGGGEHGWFKGIADHIRVYNKTFTKDEVFQLYSKRGYCFAGTDPGKYNCGCNYGWEWDIDSSVCIPKVHECSPITESVGTEWNTVSEYVQKFNFDTGKWEPEESYTQYNEEMDDSSCRYRCKHGYRWTGIKCELKPECSTGDNLGAGTTALDLLKAMDICDFYDSGVPGSWGIVPGSAVIGKANYPVDTRSVDERQYGVKTNFGTDLSNIPIFGDNMAILSSGRARDANDTFPTEHDSYEYENGNPPADFVAPYDGSLPVTKEGCPSGVGANDSVLLQVKLKVPLFAHSFSFDFRFFSQEYMYYTCTQYNDFFITMLDTGWTPEEEGDIPIPEDKNISFDSEGNYISVNSDQFFTVCEPKMGYTCLDGTAALSGTGYPPSNAGATRWLTTTAPVIPGEIITLRFIIWDTTDREQDSLVLLDNFRWHALPGAGPATYACWDTNQNGICDGAWIAEKERYRTWIDGEWHYLTEEEFTAGGHISEDINRDGVCSERDC